MLLIRECTPLECVFEEQVFGAALNRIFGRVMELVDVPDSKSGAARRAGSSPALATREESEK